MDHESLLSHFPTSSIVQGVPYKISQVQTTNSNRFASKNPRSLEVLHFSPFFACCLPACAPAPATKHVSTSPAYTVRYLARPIAQNKPRFSHVLTKSQWSRPTHPNITLTQRSPFQSTRLSKSIFRTSTPSPQALALPPSQHNLFLPLAALSSRSPLVTRFWKAC